MSPVEFKKTLCRPVDFKGQGSHLTLIIKPMISTAMKWLKSTAARDLQPKNKRLSNRPAGLGETSSLRAGNLGLLT